MTRLGSPAAAVAFTAAAALTAAVLTATVLAGCADNAAPRTTTRDTLPVADGRLVAATAFDHLDIRVPEAASGSLELDDGSATDEGRRGGTVDVRQRGIGLALSENADGVTAAATLIDVTTDDTTVTRLVLVTTERGERHTTTAEVDAEHDLLDAWWTGDEIGVVTGGPARDEVVLRTYLHADGLRLRTRLELPMADRVELGRGPGVAIEIAPRTELPITLTSGGDLTVRVLDNSVVTLVDPDGRLAFDTDASDAIVVAESQRAGDYVARITPRSNGHGPDDRVIATITFGRSADETAAG